MHCPRCGADLPEVAHFCQVCGQDLRNDDLTRRKSFAVKPDEPVASFALISSIMPRGAGQRPQTYRIALTIALTVALVAAIFGALPIAVLVAAFAVPIVYIVYIYDVNLWEDEPIPVTALAFGLTGVLATAFTILWTSLRGPLFTPGGLDGSGTGTPTVGDFLLVALLVPIVGEAIRQIGPVLLASRPEFDDLMDGLTFGVVSGVAYASFDTIVRHWALLTGDVVQRDPGLWVSLIFLEGFVKPLIFGTATGIACAEFSGLGRGYDGFTPRYYRGLAEAVAANIAYQAGSYFFSFVGDDTLGVILTLAWSLLILAVLILRVRNVLHVGLMEAALERSARGRGLDDSGELQFCAQCEMPLLAHAAFCNACGTAVRVQSKPHRAKVGVAAAGGPAADGANAVAAQPDIEETIPRGRPAPPPEGPAPPAHGSHPIQQEQVNDEEGRP
ncbi:MAG: PrsW family intramembrane metalloprotease [Propionibacteriaceae bacterium]|nr:PrsW family intramembrane metalloprotease [Propionibacteriaceae bacterium]